MTLDNPAESTSIPAPTRSPIHSALLDGLSEGEMQRVETRLLPTSCSAGAILLAQGSWHGKLHIVRSGVLVVHVETANGERRQLARLVPGDCIGEMSLLTGLPASATVTALADTELWTLGHADFLELLMTCPTLSGNLATILSRRLSVANRAMEPRLLRRMQLRVHPQVEPELPEAIARAVARHLAIPLVVLDRRPVQRWRPGELSPGLEAAEHHLLDLLRPEQPGVIAVSTLHATRETLVRFNDWLSGHVTYVLTILEIDGGTEEVPGDGAPFGSRATVDVTLWAAGDQQRPASTDGVVLVTRPAPSGYRPNSRSALERESRMRGVSIIRTLAPESSEAALDIDWLGRHLAGLKIGLALGAGGARGYAHLGVLDALQRAGVPLDFVGGCSIGGLVASGCAYGMSVDHMARELDAAPPHLVKYTLSRQSVLSDRGLKYLFRDRLFGDARMEDLSLPLAMVAVDVLQRRKVILERGLMWKGLLATTAIPGIYPPVWLGPHCLVDGGILDPVPADIIRSLGADVVLAVRLGGVLDEGTISIPATQAASEGRSPHVVDVMMRSFDTMASGITARVVEDADITLCADVPPIGLRDFARGRAFMPAGHAALAQVWPQVTAVLPWLRGATLDLGE